MSSIDQEQQIAKLEAILARDLIELANDYPTEKHIIESVSDVCFTLMTLLEMLKHDKTAISWQTLFNVYDKKYYALQRGQQDKGSLETQKVYATATHIIASCQKK